MCVFLRDPQHSSAGGSRISVMGLLCTHCPHLPRTFGVPFPAPHPHLFSFTTENVSLATPPHTLKHQLKLQERLRLEHPLAQTRHEAGGGQTALAPSTVALGTAREEPAQAAFAHSSCWQAGLLLKVINGADKSSGLL